MDKGLKFEMDVDYKHEGNDLGKVELRTYDEADYVNLIVKDIGPPSSGSVNISLNPEDAIKLKQALEALYPALEVDPRDMAEVLGVKWALYGC